MRRRLGSLVMSSRDGLLLALALLCGLLKETQTCFGYVCIGITFSEGKFSLSMCSRANACALKSLAGCARVTPASLHASPCSAKALAMPAFHTCGYTSEFLARFCSSYVEKIYSIGGLALQCF